MSRVAILVWLAAAPPSPEQQRQLDDWSRSHQLQLEAPDATAAPRAADFQALVKRLEAKLSAARLALDTLSYVKALTVLRSVQLTLAAHPEIPQAAFLRAHALRLEVRARSHGGASEGDRRTARALEQAATALEGPRAASYGATQGEAAVSRRERLRIRGAGKGDEVFLDGELVSGPVEVLPGEHHVRVLRHDQLVWSGWQRIALGQRTLQLQLPPPPACDREILRTARVRDGEIVVPGGAATCPRWVVARPAPRHPGQLELGSCSGSSCAPMLLWRRREPLSLTTPAQPTRDSGWPVWATWMLAGAAVMTTTAIVFWQTGQFDDEPEPRRGWQFTGPTTLTF